MAPSSSFLISQKVFLNVKGPTRRPKSLIIKIRTLTSFIWDGKISRFSARLVQFKKYKICFIDFFLVHLTKYFFSSFFRCWFVIWHFLVRFPHFRSYVLLKKCCFLVIIWYFLVRPSVTRRSTDVWLRFICWNRAITDPTILYIAFTISNISLFEIVPLPSRSYILKAHFRNLLMSQYEFKTTCLGHN